MSPAGSPSRSPALASAILLGPLLFWIAWNVLDFGPALGLPELGFWGIVLATLFLVAGWLGKVVITGIVAPRVRPEGTPSSPHPPHRARGNALER